MTSLAEILKEMLHAFVDNELDHAERIDVYKAMDTQPGLKEELCELQYLKHLVKDAYTDPFGQLPPRIPQAAPRQAFAGFRTAAVCAALGLATLAFAGWAVRDSATPEWLAMHDVNRVADAKSLARGSTKVLLHIDSGNPAKLMATLNQAEQILNEYRQKRAPVQVEVVANGDGLALLRHASSPYAAKVAQLRYEYGNVSFVVCKRTIEQLQKNGAMVELLPGTQVTSESALTEIVTRVRDGWAYIRA